MKKLALTFALLCATYLLHAQTLPSLWVVPEGQPVDTANIVGQGIISRKGTDGYIIRVCPQKLRKGTYIELDFSFRADTKDAPLHYVLSSYNADALWLYPIDTLKVTMEHPANGEFATSLHTYRLPRKFDCLDFVLDALEPAANPVLFSHQSNVGAYIHELGKAAPKDTLRVLCIGNSFTYVYEAPFMLKQLAWSQGHYIDMHAALRGGYNFGDHLGMQGTAEAIREGGYDFVFLQNQSQTNAWYGQDSIANRKIMQDAEELVRRIREYSPNARIIIESTWAYPGGNYGGFGSYEQYDALMEQGSQWIAERVGGEVSYINRAFIQARKLYPELAIYGGDQKHQSAYGSYLKACINYSVLFGEPYPVKPRKIHGNKANPDLWFNHDDALRLRHAASTIHH